jgi:hypothetical protein
MTMLPAEASGISNSPAASSASALERFCGAFGFHHAYDGSAGPYVWIGRDAGGVSLVSPPPAFGSSMDFRSPTRRSTSPRLIVLDAAFVAGLLVHG